MERCSPVRLEPVVLQVQTFITVSVFSVTPVVGSICLC